MNIPNEVCSSAAAIEIFCRIQNNLELLSKLEEKANWYKLTTHETIKRFGDPADWK